MPQQQAPRYGKKVYFATHQARARSGKRFLLSIIVLLSIVAGSVGSFVFIRQNNLTSAQGSTGQANAPGIPFSVTFSGPIHGVLDINAVNLCGSDQGTPTYEVDANG